MLRSTRVAVALTIAAATFTVPTTIADAAGPNTYVVVEGDSLFGISRKLGVRLPELLNANAITVDSVILPGQKLVVPGEGSGSGSGSSAPAAGGTYSVKAGDSLFGISRKVGVRLADLLRLNGITVRSVILPGQTIKLPAGAATASTGQEVGGTYTVRAGDALGRIAVRHGVSLARLLAVNAMTASSLILPGQTIKLPAGAAVDSGSGSGSAPPEVGGTYTVKAGDALGRIAVRHGVSLASLLAVNAMTASSLILPGQTIKLPAGATSPSSSGGASQAPSAGAGVQAVIDFALAQQGKPYQFAASGPDAYDCSGLTRRAYLQIGVNLVHQSAAQAQQGTPVAFTSEPILPGDLVFMATRGNDVISHVGIALSATTWIQARRPGEVVRVGPMPATSSIVAVRRLVPAG